MIKYIITILITLLNLKQSKKSHATEFVVYEIIRGKIVGEIEKSINKLLFGLILTFVVGVSFVNLSQAAQYLIRQYDNGYVYELLIFMLLMIGSSLGLYMLFHTKKSIRIEPKNDHAKLESSDPLSLQKLVQNFIDGILVGLTQPPNSKETPARMPDDQNVSTGKATL